MVKKRTQINDIINHLIKHKKISSMEAFKKYGATRLSGIIFKFKRMGFIITSEHVVGKTRYGNNSPFVIYHLIKVADDYE